MLEFDGDLRTRLEARLEPHALRLLERSAELALRLHADEVGPEHLLCALMADEDCAAHRAVQHAFADPGTVGEEALALAAGILISGSAVSLPFSEGAVRALEGARVHARARGEAAVLPAHLLAAAMGALPAQLREEAFEAGYDAAGLPSGAPPDAPGAADVPPAGALLGSLSEAAKQALSGAARLARQERQEAIGPVQLALACLLDEPALGRACGFTASRARMLFRGRGEDPTPPRPRSMPPDESFEAFLGGLGAGTTSVGLLARFHAGGTPELARILTHHRIGPDLLERAARAFRDPGA
jgi:hypothetical protein